MSNVKRIYTWREIQTLEAVCDSWNVSHLKKLASLIKPCFWIVPCSLIFLQMTDKNMRQDFTTVEITPMCVFSTNFAYPVVADQTAILYSTIRKEKPSALVIEPFIKYQRKRDEKKIKKIRKERKNTQKKEQQQNKSYLCTFRFEHGKVWQNSAYFEVHLLEQCSAYNKTSDLSRIEISIFRTVFTTSNGLNIVQIYKLWLQVAIRIHILHIYKFYLS